MHISKTFTLETPRCILRHPSEIDIPAIFSASQVEGFNDGMQWDPPASKDELLEPYRITCKAWERGTAYCFTMLDKSNGEFLGRISIRKQEQEGTWDVGFFTHPCHQGNGYMTEALKAVMEFGFKRLDVQYLIADYAIWNKASEAVLKKNGMIFLKYIPKGFQKNGQWIEENQVGISKEQ